MKKLDKRLVIMVFSAIAVMVIVTIGYKLGNNAIMFMLIYHTLLCLYLRSHGIIKKAYLLLG